MTKTALISVSDKSKIRPFAKRLRSLGFRVLSTGGTAAHLRDGGVEVTEVSEWTGSEEMLDGRVKTLHPHIHSAILADRGDAKHMASLAERGLDVIDLVVVNLYPFREVASRETASASQLIEAIDIGGVAMLRAAAKNWAHVVPIIDPEDYDIVQDALERDEVDDSLRRRMAAKVFRHTASYDAAIASFFGDDDGDCEGFEAQWEPRLHRHKVLRYGENPHQEAALYRPTGHASPVEKLHGRALGYNNVLDLDGALQLIWEFDEPTAAIIKHTNPAGCATGDDIEAAFERALAGDPMSAYGGIVAVNREVTLQLAEAVDEIFVEILAAPGFEKGAMELLRKKKRRRLIRWDEPTIPGRMVRSTCVGWLTQTSDPPITATREDWDVATKRAPGQAQWADLEMAWRVVKHIKSNAIVIVKDGQVLGVGAGQMSRVDAVEIAIDKCVADSPEDAVLASDAFFPFRDGVDRAAEAGVRAIVQPGGSRRDGEVVEACDEQGLAMAMTGKRHFRHG